MLCVSDQRGQHAFTKIYQFTIYKKFRISLFGLNARRLDNLQHSSGILIWVYQG